MLWHEAVPLVVWSPRDLRVAELSLQMIPSRRRKGSWKPAPGCSLPLPVPAPFADSWPGKQSQLVPPGLRHGFSPWLWSGRRHAGSLSKRLDEAGGADEVPADAHLLVSAACSQDGTLARSLAPAERCVRQNIILV